MDVTQSPLAAGLLTAFSSSVLALSPTISRSWNGTNGSTSNPDYHNGGGHHGRSQWSPWIGIVTALVGNVLISLALNIQRYAHIRIEREWAREKLRYETNWRRKQSSSTFQNSYGSIEGTYGSVEPRVHANDPLNALGEGQEGPSDQLQQSFLSDQTLRPGDKPSEVASRQSYLRSPYWWIGIVLMALGEAGNFMAYGFAPASIVSPLGVVALISNCVIAPIMLKERFRQRDFWGVLIAIAGAVVVVLSAPSSEEKIGPGDIWKMITRWEFELYLGLTAAFILALMWASGTYGSRTILIDVGLVALFGGYTALSTKGVSSLLSFTLWRVITFPVTYLLAFILVGSALMQIRYINRALQRFDSTQVIPTQFVLFTLSVITGSAVLYRDFESIPAERAGKFVGGCAMTFLGVYFITSDRIRGDDDSSYGTEDEEEAMGLLNGDQYTDEANVVVLGPNVSVNKPTAVLPGSEGALQSPSDSLFSQGLADGAEGPPTPKGIPSPSSPVGSLSADSLSGPLETPSSLHSQSLTTNPWAELPTPLVQATASEPHIHRPSTPPTQTGQTPPASTVILRFPAAPGIDDTLVHPGVDHESHPEGAEAETERRRQLQVLPLPHTPPAARTLRNSLSMRFSPGHLLPTISGGGFSAVVAESYRRDETSPAKERKHHRRKDGQRKRSNSAAVDELLRESLDRETSQGLQSDTDASFGLGDGHLSDARLASARLNNLSGDISGAVSAVGTENEDGTYPAGTMNEGTARRSAGSQHNDDDSTATNRLRSVSDSLNGRLAWLGGSLRRPNKSPANQSRNSADPDDTLTAEADQETGVQPEGDATSSTPGQT